MYPSPEPRSYPPQADPLLARLVATTRGLQPWRRVFHAVSGIAIVMALHWVVPQQEWQIGILSIAAACLFLGDWLRLRYQGLNRLFFMVFRPLASPRELDRPASSTWYLVGITLTVWLFPLDVAVAAILVLSLADPAASVVGRLYGRRALGKGSWAGSSTFFAVSAPILIHQAGLIGGLLAALVTTAAEVAPLRLDDNLLVPLVAGASLLVAGSLGL